MGQVVDVGELPLQRHFELVLDGLLSGHRRLVEVLGSILGLGGLVADTDRLNQMQKSFSASKEK